MNTLLKSLLIGLIGCSVANVAAMKPAKAVVPVEDADDSVYDVYLSDGKSLLDKELYLQILSLIKPSLKASLERESRKELPISKAGLREVLSALEALLKKDVQALRVIYLQYMADKNHKAFCELFSAAHILGIEAVIATVQEFYTRDYKVMIDQEDSTFFINLVNFLTKGFPALRSLGRQDDGSTLIGYAASQGKTAIVSALLACGLDGNLTDNEGVTPLMEASKNGHVEVVKVLLEKRIAVNRQDSTDHRSALMEGARAGYADIVKMLLSAKALISLVDTASMTALSHAVMNGHDECILLLGGIEAQNNLNAFKRKVRSELMMRKRNSAELPPVASVVKLVEPAAPQPIAHVNPVVKLVEPPVPQAIADVDELIEAKKLSILLHVQAEQAELVELAKKDGEYAERIQKEWEQEQLNVEIARRLQAEEDAELAARTSRLKSDEAYAARLQQEQEEPSVDPQDVALALRLHEEEMRRQPVGFAQDEIYAQNLQERPARNDFQELQDAAFARQLAEQDGFVFEEIPNHN